MSGSMAYVYESPDKGKTIYRRPARMAPPKKGRGIELGHLKGGGREVRLPDGSWRAVKPD
jgi:hypothetical protein